VLEAAVVGAEDESKLIKPKAFVVLKQGNPGSDALKAALQQHVKDKLAPYKYRAGSSFSTSCPKRRPEKFNDSNFALERGAVIVKLRSLKTKVTLIVTGCFVTLLVLVSVLEAYRVRTDLREVLGNQQHTLVSRVADEIDEKLKTTHGALIAASKVIPPDIVNDPAKLKRDLDNRAGLRSLFDSLFIFSPDGVTVVDLPATRLRGATVGDREFSGKFSGTASPISRSPSSAEARNSLSSC